LRDARPAIAGDVDETRLAARRRRREAAWAKEVESMAGSRQAPPWMYMIQIPGRAGRVVESGVEEIWLVFGIQISRV
jgi:hypothetical protein